MNELKRWYNKNNYYEINKYNVYITYNIGNSQMNINTLYFNDIKYKNELVSRIGVTLYNKIINDIKKLEF